jgi:transposase
MDDPCVEVEVFLPEAEGLTLAQAQGQPRSTANRYRSCRPLRTAATVRRFAGRLVTWAADTLRREVDIVRKQPGQRGFQVQPKRWAAERTFAWITTRRRLARDYERKPAHAETMIRWAMTDVILRRLTRGRPATRPGLKPLRQIP